VAAKRHTSVSEIIRSTLLPGFNARHAK